MIFQQLILAHLLGDFILQPNSWVVDKESKIHKSKFLYLHILIHIVLSLIILNNLDLWWVAIGVGFTHFIIDFAKLKFQRAKTKKVWFFIDQLLHISVIAGVSFYFKEFSLQIFQDYDFIKIIIGILFLTTPASIIIKTLLSSWTPFAEVVNKIQVTESLTSAGKYIGILERLLVFTFIMVGHWEGVGFMIAAKSVFRFSDLAQAKQRKLTEYVLIGTLLSFGLAIVTGIIIK